MPAHKPELLFPPEEEVQFQKVPKRHLNVKFTVDEELMRTEPFKKSKRTDHTISPLEKLDASSAALLQMGVNDKKDKLYKIMAIEYPVMNYCYAHTKADAFVWCHMATRFRFKIGHITDNSQIAELLIMRAATESRHCIYTIIRNAIKHGRSLSPEDLEVALSAVRLDRMPKGWEQLGSRGAALAKGYIPARHDDAEMQGARGGFSGEADDDDVEAAGPDGDDDGYE